MLLFFPAGYLKKYQGSIFNFFNIQQIPKRLMDVVTRIFMNFQGARSKGNFTNSH